MVTSVIILKKYLELALTCIFFKNRLATLKFVIETPPAEPSVTDSAAVAVVIINDSSAKCDSATLKSCHWGVLCIWHRCPRKDL